MNNPPDDFPEFLKYSATWTLLIFDAISIGIWIGHIVKQKTHSEIAGMAAAAVFIVIADIAGIRLLRKLYSDLLVSK